MLRKKILFIDDEPYVIEPAKIFLSKDYDISYFINPNEAVKAVLSSQQNPDLIITDHRMPGLDGPSAMKQINQDGKTIDFFAYTGFQETVMSDFEDIPGFQGIINKPSNLTSIKDTIDNYFRNH